MKGKQRNKTVNTALYAFMFTVTLTMFVQ